MVHSSEISCLSHSFAETIVINPRWILQKWRIFMFLRGTYTTMSLTFLIAIIVLEILNNVGKHFLQKIPVSHHFAEKIVANQKYILQKWRSFLFLRYPSKKTYLSVFTVISEWEIHAHLYRLFFKLSKTLF